MALQSGGTTLDPHQALDAGSQHLVELIYSTLMRYREDYPGVKPGLLEKLEAGEDDRTYRMTLRKGVRFHSGRELTARDVKFSLHRLKETGNAEPLEHLASIHIQDAYHLTLNFRRPMAPLPTYLANPKWAILDRQRVQARGGRINRVDAGSGPFRLVQWQKDQRLVLEKFEDYFVKPWPRLNRVIFRPISDTTARITSLITGETDLVLDVPVRMIDTLKHEPAVKVESVPGTFWEYIGLNTRVEPLNDPRVRRAIAWAIDRETLVRGVKFGKATPLPGGPLPPSHWASPHLSLYPRRDLDKAAALLHEAGVGEGFRLEMIVGSDFTYQVQAAQIIKQMLKPIGIEVAVRRLESTTFFTRLNEGDFEATIVGWVGLVSPDQFLYPIYHTGGSYNQQNYSDPTVDQLLERARAAGDRAERKRVYARAIQRIARQAPTVFLYITPQTSAYRKYVHGYHVHPTASVDSLRTTWVSP